METTSLGLKKPAGTDLIDIQDFNDNTDLINGELVKRPLKNGAASEMTNTFTQSASLINIISGETQKISFGKIMKSMADYFSHKVTAAAAGILGHVRLSDSYSAPLDAESTAASQQAVAKAYLELDEKMNQVNSSLTDCITWIRAIEQRSDTVTFPAGVCTNVTINFPAQAGFTPNPFIGYARSSGWAGLIPQGMSISGNSITFAIYNTTTVSRTAAITGIALYFKQGK